MRGNPDGFLSSRDVDPRALELLRRTIIGQLGFVGLDGYPRVLPVWFEYRDGDVLIASQPDTYKGRALTRNGQAALTVSTPDHPYHIASVIGDATVEDLPEPERIEFVNAIAHRYLGQEGAGRYLEKWSKGGHPGPGELVRLRPRTIKFSMS